MGAGLDQDRRDLQIAVDRGDLQPGAAVVVDLVGVVAAADQLAHLERVVVRPRRARHCPSRTRTGRCSARALRRRSSEQHEHRAAEELAEAPSLNEPS